MRRIRLLSLVLAPAVAACGGADVLQLNGAGATFPNLIYQKWILDYNGLQDAVELNYQSIGSGGGVRQFSDRTIDFGGTDAPMTDEEQGAIDGNVFHIPTVLGAVVPTYNLEGLESPLNFTPDVLAGIFLGQITKWDDPRILAENSGQALPDAEIVVVHRSDGSGTTFIWTDYLSKISETWEESVGAGKSVNWPVGLGARGNEGVTATVSQTPGAIGYVEFGYAMLNNLPSGSVQNQAGAFIAPTIEAVTAAAAGGMASMGPDTDFRVSLTNSAGEDAYPVASFTWLLLRKQYDDEAETRELIDFVWWALTERRGDAAELGYAPIPEALHPWIQDRLSTITVNGTRVWSGAE